MLHFHPIQWLICLFLFFLSTDLPAAVSPRPAPTSVSVEAAAQKTKRIPAKRIKKLRKISRGIRDRGFLYALGIVSFIGLGMFIIGLVIGIRWLWILGLSLLLGPWLLMILSLLFILIILLMIAR